MAALSAALVVALMVEATASAATFGKTTIGATPGNGLANEKAGNKFTLREPGSITQLSAYVDGLGPGTGNQVMRMLVYTDSAGVPGTKRVTSAEVTVRDGQAAGWVHFTVSPAVSLSAGTYWIVSHHGPNSNTIRRYRDTGTTGSTKYNTDSYSDGASSSFGTASNGSAIFSFYATYTPGGTLPSGFSQELVASGVSVPTAFTFLPDGRILIAQKSGLVRIVKNGTLLTAPFIDLRSRVHNWSDHGLLGVAPDPNFATNGYVYLYYALEGDPAAPDTASGAKTTRVTRVTASGDTASPLSEVVVLGGIPGDVGEHTGGNVKFASDGTMFLSTGDAALASTVDDRALRAQDVDSLAGKLLHITTTGQGISTNPFWNGDPNANRSKVWAYGLRNAFRFSLRPGTGVPYVGDVGWKAWEEVNVAAKGANLGWPCYEGNARQSGYEPKPTCQTLYGRGTSAVRFPLYLYAHPAGAASGRGGSVTAGTFYTGSAYPALYQGMYFFGDYVFGWIRYLGVDSTDKLVSGPSDFATAADGPVQIEMGSDGLLYYLSINKGELRRIRYTAGGNTPPKAQASADPTNGLAPLTVNFSSSGSLDPDGDPLTYSWNFGDGSTSTAANPQHTYSADGIYTATLTVSDGRGGTGSASVKISVGNRAPTPVIDAPSPTLRYKVGDVVNYSGSASDPEDGTIPAASLSWQVTLMHCPGGDCHSHPSTSGTGSGGSFTVPDHGDDTYFEITLTATDSGGLQGTTKVAVHPQTVKVTLASSPGSLQVVYDGVSATAPLTRTTIVGSTHTIYAPSPQGSQTFGAWSDGGAQQHTVTVGGSDTTYTATFIGPSCPAGQYLAEYYNNRTLTGSPTFTRCEAAINYDWASGGPGNGVASDNFSVRWAGRFSFAAGTYTFSARANDGVRMWLNGSLIIDAWRIQAATTYRATRTLTAGAHDIKVEFFESTGTAVAQVSW